jgi:hypothetical protein
MFYSFISIFKDIFDNNICFKINLKINIRNISNLFIILHLLNHNFKYKLNILYFNILKIIKLSKQQPTT